MDQAPSKMESIATSLDNNAERKVGETIAGRIRTSLADAITSGKIKPGSEIDELELAQSFGASRTPVREALRELAATGLVIIKPRRGARVVEMTPDLVGELFELMAEIEAICVRFATYRIKASERAALSHIHETSLITVQAQDLDAYDILNQEFHATLYEATHNSELQNYALALRQRGAPFRRAQFRGLERLKASWTEHDAILHAIFEGNGDVAAQLMRAHMLKAGNVFMDYTHEQECSPALSSPIEAGGAKRRNVNPRRGSSK
ncbi:MAG: GntR family transcriptional regulator [Rhodospirillales bacterium]|nr:GntR family transcriptional regulator [Rhodospirillales bacterium]